jgi:hypothetical protein
VNVDLAGNAHELWQIKGPLQTWGIASRDGKYLAIPAPITASNVWLAEFYWETYFSHSVSTDPS